MSKPAAIFKSPEAQGRLNLWYDKFLGRIASPVEHREVPTSVGLSHVLLAGNPEGPPLVCLHPTLTSSAHILSEIGPALVQNYRLIAPDIPGQSVLGPQVRLPLNDLSLSQWVLEVLDGLGVGDFRLFGVSWGGFVARQTATRASDRVKKLVLLVPAGIVNVPMWVGIRRMALPMIRYRMNPTEERLRAMVEPLLSTWDDDWAHYMGDSMRDFVLDLRIPPVAKDSELRSLSMPVLAFGADDDISFPGQKMLPRLRALVPHVQTEMLTGCKHCPPTDAAFQQHLANRIVEFLA